MDRIKSILLTILGTMITGFGVGVFLTPNKIVGGGATGLSTILYHTFGFEPGISFFIINMIFLLLGLKVLGKDFVFKTLIGTFGVSLFVQIFSYIKIPLENLTLVTLYGGVLYGAGIGISFASGASTGGTDILGRIVQTKFPHLPIGKLLLFIDGIIILTSLIIFKDAELVLYGITSLIISSYTIDFVISKLNISRLVFIITDKGEEIANIHVQTTPRGATLIDVKGMYTNTKKQMVFCALKESEAEELQKKVLNIDENAFIVFSESQRIKGNGFYLYK